MRYLIYYHAPNRAASRIDNPSRPIEDFTTAKHAADNAALRCTGGEYITVVKVEEGGEESMVYLAPLDMISR